jgi:hypothetical protein
MKTNILFDHISLCSSKNKKMLQTNVVEEIETHFMLSDFFF